MKTLVVFHESQDEPMEALLASVREVCAQNPPLEVEAVLAPGFCFSDPVANAKAAAKQLLSMVQASDADRGALYLALQVGSSQKKLAFRGQMVFFSTQTHLMKISLVPAANAPFDGEAMSFFLQNIAMALRNEYQVLVLDDADRAWMETVIKRIGQGMNLAMSRLSTFVGRA